MWRVHDRAGRPWPTLDDDPVIDYLIMEAVATKDAKDEEKHRKELEIKNWKKDKSALRQAAL